VKIDGINGSPFRRMIDAWTRFPVRTETRSVLTLGSSDTPSHRELEMESIPADADIKKLRIVVTPMGIGYVCIEPELSDLPFPVELESIPDMLSMALRDRIRDHPAAKVRSALPVIANGYSVAIHVWFDGAV
jgi:hypothetical protein